MSENKTTETDLETRVSVPAVWYDLAVRSQSERDQYREELRSLRKVVGRAIYQLQNGWSTNALEILVGSLEKP
jgi:hypothetical protein